MMRYAPQTRIDAGGLPGQLEVGRAPNAAHRWTPANTYNGRERSSAWVNIVPAGINKHLRNPSHRGQPQPASRNCGVAPFAVTSPASNAGSTRHSRQSGDANLSEVQSVTVGLQRSVNLVN
jgi:hypothetical protein